MSANHVRTYGAGKQRARAYGTAAASTHTVGRFGQGTAASSEPRRSAPEGDGTARADVKGGFGSGCKRDDDCTGGMGLACVTTDPAMAGRCGCAPRRPVFVKDADGFPKCVTAKSLHESCFSNLECSYNRPNMQCVDFVCDCRMPYVLSDNRECLLPNTQQGGLLFALAPTVLLVFTLLILGAAYTYQRFSRATKHTRKKGGPPSSSSSSTYTRSPQDKPSTASSVPSRSANPPSSTIPSHTNDQLHHQEESPPPHQNRPCSDSHTHRHTPSYIREPEGEEELGIIRATSGFDLKSGLPISDLSTKARAMSGSLADVHRVKEYPLKLVHAEEKVSLHILRPNNAISREGSLSVIEERVSDQEQSSDVTWKTAEKKREIRSLRKTGDFTGSKKELHESDVVISIDDGAESNADDKGRRSAFKDMHVLCAYENEKGEAVLKELSDHSIIAAAKMRMINSSAHLQSASSTSCEGPTSTEMPSHDNQLVGLLSPLPSHHSMLPLKESRETKPSRVEEDQKPESQLVTPMPTGKHQNATAMKVESGTKGSQKDFKEQDSTSKLPKRSVNEADGLAALGTAVPTEGLPDKQRSAKKLPRSVSSPDTLCVSTAPVIAASDTKKTTIASVDPTEKRLSSRLLPGKENHRTTITDKVHDENRTLQKQPMKKTSQKELFVESVRTADAGTADVTQQSPGSVGNVLSATGAGMDVIGEVSDASRKDSSALGVATQNLSVGGTYQSKGDGRSAGEQVRVGDIELPSVGITRSASARDTNIQRPSTKIETESEVMVLAKEREQPKSLGRSVGEIRRKILRPGDIAVRENSEQMQDMGEIAPTPPAVRRFLSVRSEQPTYFKGDQEVKSPGGNLPETKAQEICPKVARRDTSRKSSAASKGEALVTQDRSITTVCSGEEDNKAEDEDIVPEAETKPSETRTAQSTQDTSEIRPSDNQSVNNATEDNQASGSTGDTSTGNKTAREFSTQSAVVSLHERPAQPGEEDTHSAPDMLIEHPPMHANELTAGCHEDKLDRTADPKATATQPRAQPGNVSTEATGRVPSSNKVNVPSRSQSSHRHFGPPSEPTDSSSEDAGRTTESRNQRKHSPPHKSYTSVNVGQQRLDQNEDQVKEDSSSSEMSSSSKVPSRCSSRDDPLPGEPVDTKQRIDHTTGKANMASSNIPGVSQAKDLATTDITQSSGFPDSGLRKQPTPTRPLLHQERAMPSRAHATSPEHPTKSHGANLRTDTVDKSDLRNARGSSFTLESSHDLLPEGPRAQDVISDRSDDVSRSLSTPLSLVSTGSTSDLPTTLDNTMPPVGTTSRPARPLHPAAADNRPKLDFTTGMDIVSKYRPCNEDTPSQAIAGALHTLTPRKPPEERPASTVSRRREDEKGTDKPTQTPLSSPYPSASTSSRHGSESYAYYADQMRRHSNIARVIRMGNEHYVREHYLLALHQRPPSAVLDETECVTQRIAWPDKGILEHEAASASGTAAGKSDQPATGARGLDYAAKGPHSDWPCIVEPRDDVLSPPPQPPPANVPSTSWAGTLPLTAQEPLEGPKKNGANEDIVEALYEIRLDAGSVFNALRKDNTNAIVQPPQDVSGDGHEAATLKVAETATSGVLGQCGSWITSAAVPPSLDWSQVTTGSSQFINATETAKSSYALILRGSYSTPSVQVFDMNACESSEPGRDYHGAHLNGQERSEIPEPPPSEGLNISESTDHAANPESDTLYVVFRQSEYSQSSIMPRRPRVRSGSRDTASTNILLTKLEGSSFQAIDNTTAKSQTRCNNTPDLPVEQPRATDSKRRKQEASLLHDDCPPQSSGTSELSNQSVASPQGMRLQPGLRRLRRRTQEEKPCAHRYKTKRLKGNLKTLSAARPFLHSSMQAAVKKLMDDVASVLEDSQKGIGAPIIGSLTTSEEPHDVKSEDSEFQLSLQLPTSVVSEQRQELNATETVGSPLFFLQCSASDYSFLPGSRTGDWTLSSSSREELECRERSKRSEEKKDDRSDDEA